MSRQEAWHLSERVKHGSWQGIRLGPFRYLIDVGE